MTLIKRLFIRATGGLLLFVYGGVGVAGHLPTLILMGAGGKEARVAPERSPVQKPGRVSLYQERHLPAPVTAAAPEPATVIDLWPPHRPWSSAVLSTKDEAFPCGLTATRSPSRAPPAFPAVP